MRRIGSNTRRIVLIAITAMLVTATPAGAQATSAATPHRAGKASTLHFDVDGLASPLDARLPRNLTVAAPRGFRADRRAVSKRCREQSAKLNECPRGSLMGTGSLLVEIRAPDGGIRDTRIRLRVFLSSRSRILAVAYVFGWQVVPGTFRTASGIAVTFNGLPSGEAFEPLGFSFRLKRISLELGASRVIARRSVRRVDGGRARVTRRRVHLIRNPATCRTRSWKSSVSLTYRAGTPLVVPLAAPTPCEA
jgi:hypothetical protein